jgi:hypothetical protein
MKFIQNEIHVKKMGLGSNQPGVMHFKPVYGNVQVIVWLQRVQCGRIVHAFYGVVAFYTL